MRDLETKLHIIILEVRRDGLPTLRSDPLFTRLREEYPKGSLGRAMTMVYQAQSKLNLDTMSETPPRNLHAAARLLEIACTDLCEMPRQTAEVKKLRVKALLLRANVFIELTRWEKPDATLDKGENFVKKAITLIRKSDTHNMLEAEQLLELIGVRRKALANKKVPVGVR